MRIALLWAPIKPMKEESVICFVCLSGDAGQPENSLRIYYESSLDWHATTLKILFAKTENKLERAFGIMS